MILQSFIKKVASSFQNFIFLFIFLTSLVLSLIIFLSLSGNFSNLEQVQEISSLISANYILIIALILISINKIYKIFREKQFKSKFRVQFTSLFIIISFIPTTLITLFSLIFFDQGVKIWFNEKLEKVIYESKKISESYFNEHKKNIKNDILFINDEFIFNGKGSFISFEIPTLVNSKFVSQFIGNCF